ncbi:MAG: hypothetical protein QOF84_2457 [Streptomyces sp.]|nr:hypothetical protein [Streptomyces sp.]
MITWTFPDKTATAPARIVGGCNPSAASWLPAWANECILPDMNRDSRVVREWAQEHGHAGLTQPKVEVDQETAGSLAALALRIARATGFYRGTGSASIPIITFGPVTLTGESGDVSTFEIDIG